jgi:hypothetical protein
MIKYNNMMVYHALWHGQKSFRMMPLSEDCPFNEVLYNPIEKVLAVISKDQKEKPQLLPKLNEKGELVKNKPGSSNPWQEERRMMPAYYEYYIEDMSDIDYFIKCFAVNADHMALNVLSNIDDALPLVEPEN